MNWSASNGGLPPYADVYALAIDPSNPNIIYAGTERNGVFSVFKSTDGGGNWSASSNGLTNTRVNALAIDLSNPGIIYVGTSDSWDGNGGGVFKSTDGGANWSASNNGLPSYADVYALAIDPSNPNIIYAGTYGSSVFKLLPLSSVEGAWDVIGTVKTKTSIRGVGSDSETVALVDKFIFFADGAFQMIDINGTWTQTEKKLTVYLDPIGVAIALEADLMDKLRTSYGYDFDVSTLAVTQNSFITKKSNDVSTLKGKYKLTIQFSVYIYDLGREFTGKATVAASFVGIRNVGLP